MRGKRERERRGIEVGKRNYFLMARFSTLFEGIDWYAVVTEGNSVRGKWTRDGRCEMRRTDWHTIEHDYIQSDQIKPRFTAPHDIAPYRISCLHFTSNQSSPD